MVTGIWAWPALYFYVTIFKRPKYCASEHASCINGPGWYECDCIAPFVGASGNYCEYFNYCNNDWSKPCHETALCQYGPVFSQGNVKNRFGMNLIDDFQFMVKNLENSLNVDKGFLCFCPNGTEGGPFETSDGCFDIDEDGWDTLWGINYDFLSQS